MKSIKAIVLDHWFSSALIVVLGFFLWQNFVLSTANRSIRLRLEYFLASSVQQGDQIKEIRGSGLSGSQAIESAVGHSGTLIISMSSKCGICIRNLPAWRRLAAHARASNVHVVWVSRDAVQEMSEFAAKEQVADAVIADPVYSTWIELRLGAVPQTLVLGSDGKVRQAHVGEIDTGVEQDLVGAVSDVSARTGL